MNKLKKCLGAVAAAAVLALSFVAVQPVNAASSNAESATEINKFPAANVGVHDKLDFYGTKPLRLIGSVNGTAATLLHAGALFLDAVCPFGGTIGKYSLALDSGDSASVANLTIDSLSLAATPNVPVIDSTSAGYVSGGCWRPNAPIKLAHGLVGVQNSSGHSTLFYVHCADGDNPCIP
jgi:hypothetical protein